MALALTDAGTGKFIDLPSGKVYYNEAGEGHPVILLHGSGPGATGWSNFGPNIAGLAEHFKCYALDMPGWGRSDTVTPDERNHPRTALEFLDALGVGRAAFIGNSMGGATSIHFGALYPERQSHLITMGAATRGAKLFGPGDGPSEGLKALFNAYRNPSIETMRTVVDVMTYDSGPDADRLAKERYEALVKRPDHIENFLKDTRKISSYATEEEVASITAPALLIHGRDDRVVHFENSLKLIALIPDSRLLLLNHCGHWAQAEHTAEFNRVVLDFIKNN